ATDALTIRDKQFPVWSRGVASLTTRFAGIGGALNVPVSIGGVIVNPGDAILADESGVIVMAPEEVSAIASHAIEVQEAEEVLLAKIADGACLPDLTGSSKLIEEVNARG
ncbi:MAG: RraA family protein, partial [Cobetia sp.]